MKAVSRNLCTDFKRSIITRPRPSGSETKEWVTEVHIFVAIICERTPRLGDKV